MTDNNLIESVQALGAALKFREKALEEHIYYAGIAKCFEVALEYAWKHLKRQLDEKGLEAYGPKDVIREAGRAGLLDNVELWLQAVTIRNYAVHNYLGVTAEEYLDFIQSFLPRLRKLSTSA